MNEGKRTRFEQYLFKKMGAKSGCPDLLIFEPKLHYMGLAIELKIKPNKCTPNQKEFLQQLENKSWKVAVCYSFDEFEREFKNYRK